MKNVLILLSVVCALFSCSTYSDEQMDEFDREIASYVKKNNIASERSSSGLYYRIDSIGTGKDILYTDSVCVTYKGTFLSGKVFEEQHEPVQFQVRGLIAAWQEVLLNMKEGGRAYMITPPQLAYGDRELDDIPANSILVYELRVAEVK